MAKPLPLPNLSSPPSAVPTPRADLPLATWIGDPPGVDLIEGLHARVRVRAGWHADAAVVIVRAHLGPQALGKLPIDRGLPPILATSAWIPSPQEIAAWRKAGAHDLVPMDRLLPTIEEILREEGNQTFIDLGSVDLDALAAIDMDDSLLDEEAIDEARAELEAGEAEDFADWHTGPVDLDEVDEFDETELEELEEPEPPTTRPIVPPKAMAQLRRIQCYLARRAIWLAGRRMGLDRSAQRLDAFLALCRIRDHLSEDEDIPDLYGLVCGRPANPVEWRALVRRPAAAPGAFPPPCIETAIISLGSDGLVFSAPRPPRGRPRLVIEVDGGHDGRAEILIEARHHTRRAEGDWQIAAVILEASLS